MASTMTSVAASGTGITNGNGDLTVGSVVTLTLPPTLSDGGTATYTGGSGRTAVKPNGATITDSAGNAATLSGTLTPPGTLQIDTKPPATTVKDPLTIANASSFLGTVAGMTGQDTIDFVDINFTKVQTPGYTGNSSGGTLTVTDGTHSANIALLGNYLASSFVTSSDGHGETILSIQR